MRSPSRRLSTPRPRAVPALLSLGVFLLGTNFCVFAPPESLNRVPGTGEAAQVTATSPHACCTSAARAAARPAEDAREAGAPCCVAVAPVVAAQGAEVSPAPMIAILPMAAPVVLPVSLPGFERLALAEDVRPPVAHAATPDAGRAPPLL